jgi:UDP-N-acetyl-D-mannosaminuronic acid dehydrogenase
MTIFSKISVVGLGYIGLPTAAMFASKGIEVIGLDVSTNVVNTINKGEIHIIEPGLSEIVSNTVANGKLRATLKPETSQAFLIAVPTPFSGNNHEPDLSYIKSACKSIAPVLEKGNLVILESTSPIGATEKMANWLSEYRPDLSFPQSKGEAADISIAHCPERVLPGRVMEELIINDRVIGGMTEKCSLAANDLYSIFVTGKCVIASGPAVAEMAKLTENSFRDVNIAFANELSMICDKLDVDVWELIALSNRHPRVNILQPGPGVGGHCIAVDPWFIVSSCPDLSHLVRTAREVNDKKPFWVIDQILDAVNAVSSANKIPTVALLGLAFKPNIDDMRESPAIEIGLHLLKMKKLCNVVAVEPNVFDFDVNGLNLVPYDDAMSLADIVVVLVDHDEFKAKEKPLNKIVIDTRGMWQ